MKKIILLLILVFLIPQAYAIGIMPAGKLVEYSPGETLTYQITIINNDQQNMMVDLTVNYKNQAPEFVQITPSTLSFSSNEDKKTATVSVTMPKNLEPGTTSINIIGKTRQSQGEGTVTVQSMIVSPLRIEVPYPGKYVRAALQATRTNPNHPTQLTISIHNMGEQNINSAKAEIEIYSPTNELLDVVSTDQKYITSKQEEKLLATWDAPNPGRYYARGFVDYDGEKLLIEHVFEVGQKNLEILDIEVDNYRLGNIIKLTANIRNTWNQKITSANLGLEVKKQNQTLKNTVSSNMEVDAYSNEEFELFLDTQGLEPGNYEFNFLLNFDGILKQETRKITLDLQDLEFLDTGMVVGSKQEIGQYTLLILLAIIILILNIIILIYIFKTKK